MKWIVMCGNPTDGFTFTGPFDTWDDAHDWGQLNALQNWWVVPMQTP